MSVSNKCSRHSSHSDPSEMLSSHMTCETVNSEVGVVKSSNCVINIEYMVQDEKIMFEVFKSTVDSNCVLKRNIVLNKSNDPSNDIKEFISSLSDTAPFGSMKINKTCQTDPVDLLSTEPKKRTRSPKNKKVAFECPEKDTTGKIDSTEYKEIYAVSSFKFIESKPIGSSTTKHNFCALNFDGTISRKHRHSAKATRTIPTNLARVKSDTNILRVANNLLKEKTDNRISDKVKNIELTKANENKMQKDVKKKRHKSVETTNKKQYDEPDTKHERTKNDGAQFEIVLTPRRPKNCYRDKVEQEKNSETINLSRQKPRKFIVKSNTLELLTKPEMKSVALQTTPSSFIDKNILLKDLYAKPYHNTVNNIKSLKSMDSGDANLEEVNLQEENEVTPQNCKKEVNKYKRRPLGELNLTKTVNPCIEIKTGPENIELSPRKIRPTIPRRRVNTYESCTDENVTLNKPKMELPTSPPVPSIRTKILGLREDTTKIPETHLINDNLIVEDLSMLKTHITNWLTNNRKHKNVNTDEYNKEVDELCSKITTLLHMKPDEENGNAKSGKKQENVDKSEIIHSKSPREKFGIMKQEPRRNKVVSKPVNITMIEQLKNKSPRLKICRNDDNNVIIFNENEARMEQNKFADADQKKAIMQNAFGREISSLSSKTAKTKCYYNKNDIKTQLSQNKTNDQIKNPNCVVKNENYPHTNVSKRLRIETKNQLFEEANCLNVTSNVIQRHQQQNKSNTTPNKSFSSKKYEHTKINEQFFKQCMASRKRNNAFLNGDSTVTINSQENKSTITGGQKRKSGIPLRSRTFSELTKPNTAPTKPDMFNASTGYLSRNSLDTNISEMSKIKEPSLKQDRSAIFNSQNFEEFKSKTKCTTFEKFRPQNPGSIINSTFLFTKVNMDSNATSCFSKRKEYSNNLKLKKKIPSEGQQSSDINQATNRNRFQTSFKRKYTPSRPVFFPNLYQLSKYKTVSNICKPMQEQNNPSTVLDSNFTVQPTELKTGSLLTTDNKEKSSLFPYHFNGENCDDNDYESLSDNNNAATDTFLKPYPLVENSQVYMVTNVKTNATLKSNEKISEQSKPQFSISKATNKVNKPRLSTNRTSLSTKIKTSRTTDIVKCNKGKNTTYTKQLEMRKVLLGEIKACCSLCCKKNAESDNTFKNNSENNGSVSRKLSTKGTGLISILKTRSNVNAKKKSVKIDERENIYKEDVELEPKVSYEYWRCSVLQNSPFTNKVIDNDKQESMQQNKLENLNNGITDDDMTFYSSHSIALNKSTICNSEELNTDTTDSFKSSSNMYDETNNENKAITVILDTNQTVHRTDSNAESEYGLVCSVNSSELKKSKSAEQVDSDKFDSGNMLGLKKSNMFKNINKFFRKKCSKTRCNISNVS